MNLYLRTSTNKVLLNFKSYLYQRSRDIVMSTPYFSMSILNLETNHSNPLEYGYTILPA